MTLRKTQARLAHLVAQRYQDSATFRSCCGREIEAIMRRMGVEPRRVGEPIPEHKAISER